MNFCADAPYVSTESIFVTEMPGEDYKANAPDLRGLQ